LGFQSFGSAGFVENFIVTNPNTIAPAI